jgi:hypothetical protein
MQIFPNLTYTFLCNTELKQLWSENLETHRLPALYSLDGPFEKNISILLHLHILYKFSLINAIFPNLTCTFLCKAEIKKLWSENIETHRLPALHGLDVPFEEIFWLLPHFWIILTCTFFFGVFHFLYIVILCRAYLKKL